MIYLRNPLAFRPCADPETSGHLLYIVAGVLAEAQEEARHHFLGINQGHVA